MDELGQPKKMSPAKKALCIAVASFCVWGAWDLLRDSDKTHAFGDLSGGIYTDHFSHMNAARIFPKAGMQIWSRPIRQLYPEYPLVERSALPADVRAGASPTGGTYKVPGWPKDKPLVASWTHAPRNYPPGDLLLFAPIAAVYHYSKLPLKWANRLLILMCIAFSHVAL